MTIFPKNLFNIITNHEETVYTFGQIFYIFGLPAKTEERSVVHWNTCHLDQADLQEYMGKVFGSGYLLLV